MLCILLPCKTVQKDIWSIIDRYMIDILCKGNYKLYIRGYSPLFPNLITKESYDRWVTRRVWGFRHKISKAKYLKMSVANIGKLQENLDIKYIKKNISKCRLHISGSFRRTPWHCAKWLRNSPGKRFQRIRICLTREVETPSSPIRHQASDAKYPDEVSDVKYPDGMSAENNSGCEISGWNVDGAEFRMWDIRVECRRSRIPDVRYPSGMSAEQLHPDSPRGHVARSSIRTPSGRSIQHLWTSHPRR